MSVGLVVFLFAVATALIAMACGAAVYAGRNFVSKKYDERQQIDRGNAYRFSFYVGTFYYLALLIYFVFHTGEDGWVIEPFVLLLIGILLQLQSFHIYCVMTHSALPLGEKPLPTIIGYFVLGTMYLVQYFGQYIPEDGAASSGITGALSYNLLRILIALDFFSLAVIHLIAHLRKEKE